MNRFGFVGSIHMSWLSPCGGRSCVHALPASVDFWNPTFGSYSVSLSFGSANTRV